MIWRGRWTFQRLYEAAAARRCEYARIFLKDGVALTKDAAFCVLPSMPLQTYLRAGLALFAKFSWLEASRKRPGKKLRLEWRKK